MPATISLIACPNCGAENRVPIEKLARGLQPVCGRCKKPLPTAATGPITVTDATFADQVERAPLPVLVDMWAPWCGPCRFLSPVIEELAAQLAGRIRVAKLNVDENPATSARFNIQSIPALLIFQNGQEVDRLIGAQPKNAILSRLQRLL